MSCAEPKRKFRCIGTVRPRRPMTSRRSGRILIVTGPSSCCRSCHVTTSGRRTGRAETASLTSVGPAGVGPSTSVRRRLVVEAPIELGLRALAERRRLNFTVSALCVALSFGSLSLVIVIQRRRRRVRIGPPRRAVRRPSRRYIATRVAGL